MCSKLLATLAHFAVLGPVDPHTIKPFLSSFLSRRHPHEKRYQALSRFSVLIATKSWAGHGSKARVQYDKPYKLFVAITMVTGFISLMIETHGSRSLLFKAGSMAAMCTAPEANLSCMVTYMVCKG